MSARSSELNLLPKEVWERGLTGQLLAWILSAGRYVVVFTELVVISAFLYRFGLDRALTDLRASLKEKQAIIESYGDLEANFRLVQKKLTTVKTISDQPRVLKTLETLSKITPADAVLTNIAVSPKAVAIEGRVSSQAGLATLLHQAQSQPDFADVVLENVQSASGTTGSIEFKLTLTYKTS